MSEPNAPGGPGAASDPTGATQAPGTAVTAAAGGKNPAVEVVERFLDAMKRMDNDAALALLADDVVYQNVSLPAAKSKEAVARQLTQFSRYVTRFDAINHRIVGDGGTVLTERTDIIEVAGKVSAEFWVCGTFEVRDGRIVLWRDYFDWANILAATAKGAGRALVGAVRGLRR
jgi:limonene-1,2-epoxide hydrolase